MPWQRAWNDVVGEIDPETGLLAYREDRAGTPRQSGKTSDILARMVHRALACGNRRLPFGIEPQNIRYGAQTGSDARKKWQDDWLPILRRSRLHAFCRERLANGHEALLFINGSRQDLLASTDTSGHGGTIDMGLLDEVFAHKDARYEQSVLPAMLTRPQPQLAMYSTAGTPTDSPFWYGKVLHGRKLVEKQIDDVSARRGIAYLEFSAPDDADPFDPHVWWDCMPALGYTITEDSVRSALESMLADPERGVNEFKRAYLNQWVSSMGDPIVPIDLWNALSLDKAPRPAWVVLGLDVAPKDAHASVVACGEGSDGLVSTVVEHGDGVAWLLPSPTDPVGALGRLRDRYDQPYVVVEERAVAHLLPEIERVMGFDRVIRRKTLEMRGVCAFWLRLVKEKRLWHRGEPELTVALAGAQRRTVGDGWSWSAGKSGVDITPVVGQSLAASFWLGAYGSADGSET